MLEKNCARPMCRGMIRERYPSALKRRLYCCWRCVQWAGVQAKLRGDTFTRRAALQIMRELGVEGEPSLRLIKMVRKLRRRAYSAGWYCVQRKVRRAVARGVLVHVRKSAA